MKSSKLKRNIGLLPATSIGLGTMLGAGIFVFPGLAGGEAGVLAVISFLIGGIIALSVAVCTAELATAMPNSGGGYFFISRTFGGFWGTLMGIAQWIGLVFASAFYLISLAEYASSLLKELNINWDINKSILAFAITLLLLVINITGTKKVARFQNLTVISLTVILVLLFSYGLIDYMAIESNSIAVEEIAPKGVLSVFTTTALLFTSFLGFVQIANVGSEIKKPSTNLPRSLMGSVIIATVLYVFIMGVCLVVFPQELLNQHGETATIEVARKIVGNWGAIVIVFAGVLAALSSANASMLSASRSIFALSNDKLISTKVSGVNKRFGTPHIALILVALPISIMLIRSRLEVFAEVASFLHLIIYAGICLSLLKLRRISPSWYMPSFKVSSANLVAGFGLISCIFVIFFMQRDSILIGTSILLAGASYYFFYVKKLKIKLESPEPPHIDNSLVAPKVLVPIDITEEKKDVPEIILKAIPISKLLLLGFKETPEQSLSEQSKQKFGEKGEKMLEGIEKQLKKSKIDFDSELIFSDKVADQIKQIIEKEKLRFILMLKPLSVLNQLVIPIYHESQINKQLSTVIYKLSANHPKKIKVLLFTSEEDKSTNESSLKQAMETLLYSVGINTIDFEAQALEKASPSKIMQKSFRKQDLIVWSEATHTQENFLLDIILGKNSKNNDSPNIIILKEVDK